MKEVGYCDFKVKVGCMLAAFVVTMARERSFFMNNTSLLMKRNLQICNKYTRCKKEVAMQLIRVKKIDKIANP